MARVLIATQSWGVIQDRSGNAQPNKIASIDNTDGTDATTWSAQTGGSSTTSDQLSGLDGSIPRWIDEGEYDLTVSGVTKRVQAVHGNSLGGGVSLSAIDAKGDLLVGTAADTIARLAVGSNGKVLMADSAQTAGMKWGDAASGGYQAVSYAASIAPDASAGEVVKVGALTGNITVNAPTNGVAGQSLKFVFIQDATGGRTVTWNAAFLTPDWNPALGPSKVATIEFIYDGTNWRQLSQTSVTKPWFLNVMDFGAVCDVTTDDTAAIQRAIDSFWPNTSGHGSTWKKGVIFFPTGTSSYLVNSTINIDAGSVGSTPDITFLGYGATIYTTTASDSPVWNITDASTSALSISFSGLNFYVNCARTSHRLFNAEYTRFDHCRWNGGGSQAVHLAHESGISTGNSWDHCHFDNIARAFVLQGGSWTTITNSQFQEGVTLNWIDIPSKISSVTGSNATDTFTSTAHGLFNGTSLTLAGLTGGSGLSTVTTYYVTQRTADTFKLATSVGGSAVDLGSDVSSVQITPHGGSNYLKVDGNQIYGQGATLPVVRLGQGDLPSVTNNNFTHCSQNAIELGFSGWVTVPKVSGNSFKDNYRSDIEYNGAPNTDISGNVHGRRYYLRWNVTATMTIATPGVVTVSNHGLVADEPVRLSSSGALPTGLTAGTTYYVRNPATNTFELAATAGGASIATSGSQSGTHKLLSGYSPIHASSYNGAPDAGNGTSITANIFEDGLALVNGITKVPYAIETASAFTKMAISANNRGELALSIAGTPNGVVDPLNGVSIGATTNTAFQGAQTAANVLLENKLLSTDANPTIRVLGDGTIKLGAGGGSALDLFLDRIGADTLRLKDHSGNGGMEFSFSSTQAKIRAYDETASAYRHLDLLGDLIQLRASGTTRLAVDGTGIAFFAGTTAAKQTVTGSRGGNAALASLLTALATYGLITDSSS